jgi:F-type H+-transporting ATPase subunit b
MDAILQQLGGLFLGSVPTIILFLLLVGAYGFLVRRPLDEVLAERRRRTTGAVEEARSAINQAETETALFEEKLRVARAELFQARDQRLKRLAMERDLALSEARSATQAKVLAARTSLERSATTARQQIDAMSEELSAQVLKAVLPSGAVGTGAAQ